uniref:Ribosomal protein eL8/eL30/eS12/Gadd45 domain-containing protein n=1 Tax=Cannabis sativa TaxID=3483 RepID=A0A803NQ17_CANSA
MELPLTITKAGAEGASVDSSRKEDSFVVLGHSSSQKKSSSANTCYYEGERLTWLLQSIQRKIELVRADASLPEKIWFKQQFSIGVNEVTRVLEHMAMPHNSTSKIQLQALLVASDTNPRWLTKHLPSLALSRKVPLFILKDNKQASLRLGQLVHLKTAIVIGIKDKHNSINQLFAEILANDFTNAETQ